MKLKDMVDSISRNVTGGKTGQGSQFDPQYIKKMIHSFRAMQIENDFRKTGVVQPSCYQRCYLQFSQSLQSSAPNGAVLFSLPTTIALGKEDGIRYAGSISCSKTWIRIFNRGELNVLNSHSYTCLKNNPDCIYFLYDNTNYRIEVYNDPLVTEGMIEGVFSNPCDVQNYNQDTDQYPINEDAIPEIKSLIYQERTSIDKATPIENEFDASENKTVKPPYQKPMYPQQPQ